MANENFNKFLDENRNLNDLHARTVELEAIIAKNESWNMVLSSKLQDESEKCERLTQELSKGLPVKESKK